MFDDQILCYFLLNLVLQDNQSADQKDAQAVKEAVLQAIQNWSEVTQQE